MALQEFKITELVSNTAIQLGFLKQEGLIKHLHKERIPENAVKPYVSIDAPITVLRPQMGNRAELSITLVVRVHPEDNRLDMRSYFQQMISRIEPTLFRVPISGSVLRCRQFTTGEDDDILHIQANYTLKVILGGDDSNKVYMENLDLDVDTKK